MNQFLKFVLAALVFSLVSACATRVPVYNIVNAPVDVSNKKATLDEVGDAIRRAGAALGWQMKLVKPGLIAGTLNLRTHTANVDIAYNYKTYDITYKDSANLDYEGGTIHKNYNGWIQNLDRQIRANLSAL